MNIIFLGPPYSGKGTQAKLLSQKLHIPSFSMGELIRDAISRGNEKVKKGYEDYAMKGYYLPVELKFDLIKEKLERSKNGFIVDNFPSNKADLDMFNRYMLKKGKTIDKVFNIMISEEEMLRRFVSRGRPDDTREIVLKRRVNQDKERLPVLKYFKENGILVEINGEQSVEDIFQDILSYV